MTGHADVFDIPRSPSQAEQYLKCPEQYRLRRVVRVEPRPAAWSHQGSAFHSAIEAFELGGRKSSAREVQEVFGREYSRLTKSALNKEPNLDRWMTAGPPGGADIENRYRLGLKQTESYVQWSRGQGPRIWQGADGAPGVELDLAHEICGVKVRGIIDQLIVEADGSARIRDLKTGSSRSKFQLETYAVLVRKALGVETNGGDWYMAKTGRLSRRVDLSHATEEAVGSAYAELDRGIKAGEFPARPGFHCRFCDVSHACNYARR
ncbi:PD-(D/E)XK nuclease superfamily protein [Streptomyces sp. YIM 121038]|uniref:PD-(D/E)XK nuclease family protein n=1 Tax=Streptomyces sp. YIM 121038 TaxID=2136401 RepID=UPI001110946D|nr:PD-(D/E)XK nuclease family protein [Streptomyces sp. YIM 121038]QCX75700.1 PD-(D/E)XK nuclease superfamily protein [Streptomyces sp. YIM 121038]